MMVRSNKTFFQQQEILNDSIYRPSSCLQNWLKVKNWDQTLQPKWRSPRKTEWGKVTCHFWALSMRNLDKILSNILLKKKHWRRYFSKNFAKFLTLQCIMFQNVQTQFKRLAAFAARFLKCVWPFCDILH